MDNKAKKKVVGLLKASITKSYCMPVLQLVNSNPALSIAWDYEIRVVVSAGTSIPGCYTIEQWEHCAGEKCELMEGGKVKTETREFPIVSAGEYPDCYGPTFKMEDANYKTIEYFGQSAQSLFDEMTKVRTACSDDETRPNLQGVYFHGDILRATNDHWLMQSRVQDRGIQSALIPARVIDRAKKLDEITHIDITRSAKEGYVIFEGKIGGVRAHISARLLDSEFPDCDAVIPKETGTIAGQLVTRILSPTLKRAAKFVTDKGKGVKLTINGLIAVEANQSDKGKFRETVQYLSYNTPEIAIGYNALYFDRAINALGENCEVEHHGELGPTVLRSGDSLALVMPMRID